MGSTSRLVGAVALSIIPVVVVGALSAPATTAGTATAIGTFWILVAARLDMLSRRLPDRIVVLAVLPTAMAAAVLTLQGSTSALPGVGRGAAVWALPLLVAHSVAPAALGFGDVKTAAAIGAIVGLTERPVAVALALAAALATAVLWGAVTGRSEIALGPFLGGGALGILMVGLIVEDVS